MSGKHANKGDTMASIPADVDMEDFTERLAHLVNSNGLEAGCDMPDWAIAQYLTQAYYNLCEAAATKVTWGLHAEVSVNDPDPQVVVYDAAGNEYGTLPYGLPPEKGPYPYQLLGGVPHMGA